ncbi:envoplakin a isoform X2 [Sinocyclocheilus grahami]|uniref:envoplakin a isoform X2 n=1 Tax=Sinocyclocheilus grahami TaxID=75366 RepID=UPI0007AD61DB|nr:PREDICTED: envoplakin isoform X2 [Sinocyclocheilus grahami]
MIKNRKKSQVSNLALLIARMQKNADTVEKDILRAEELLLIDADNEKNNRKFQHQKETADLLGQAEGLLKDLFLDIDKAKKMKHPQAGEIENDVSRLHERWLKDCTLYRELYEQLNEVGLQPRINWALVLNQKQKEASKEEYGPTLADLKKQIAAHNILHKEIESYNNQLCPGSTSSQEEYDAIKKQYSNLLDNSKWRRHYLNSLYDYMQDCEKEVGYMREEQNKILKQDWSDQMVDHADIRRQYENFKNNSLLSHESEVNKLQDDGDRLIELKHPAASTVQAQRDTMRNEWQKFLNLCICQETHLDNMEEYKRYQLDADTLSESLSKLGSTVDTKALNGKTSSEIQMQLEAEERPLQRNEQLLADLRKRSTSITPLKLRRTPPSKTTTVESLCDWKTPKASLNRGELFNLKSNTDSDNWEVQSNDGTIKKFPGVCFLIPPPDPDAIKRVDLLGKELEDLKKRRAALRTSLNNQPSKASVSQAPVPAPRAEENSKAVELDSRLNQMDKDLAEVEMDTLRSLRAPLNRTDPATDLAKRLTAQERTTAALQQLEKQRAAAQKDLEPLLSKDSNGPTSSTLPQKLSDAKSKQDSLAALIDLYRKKANASMVLERQLRKMDSTVSGFEKQLSDDGAITGKPSDIQIHTQEIQGLRKDVAGAQSEMQNLSEDLEALKKLCSSLQQGYQEYCPDIRRQAAEVKNLQSRYANVSNQLNERERFLQEANTKHQDFQNVSQSLSSFLHNLPDNKINPTDDLSQVNAKQNSQKRVMEDIQRKGDDMDRVVDLSKDLQNVLKEYEMNCVKYKATLDDIPATDAKRNHTSTLASSVAKQEKDLTNHYAETAAESEQLLNQMNLAKSIMAENVVKVNAVQQQQMQQKAAEDTEVLQKELKEEIAKCTNAENSLSTIKNRYLSLKNRRGVERVEEKEILQYYRDPKLEVNVEDFQKKIHEEALKCTKTQSEIEVLTRKITSLESELKNTKPKLVTREVTEVEKDPQLDLEASNIRENISRLRSELKVKDQEKAYLQTEMTILEQKKQNIKEKVVQMEVVRLEKDPEMLKAVRTFEMAISDEGERAKSLKSEISQTRSQINSLERLIPTLEPKVVTKEVKRVEQDPRLISESKDLLTTIEKVRNENKSLMTDLSNLQSHHVQIQQMKPKVEVKEIINENFRVAPETEAEMQRLRRELQDNSRQLSDFERQVSLVRTELEVLYAQKPKIEYKDVVQEVVKEERSPENVREIQRLSDQVYSLQKTYSTLQDELIRLRKDRDEWKAEKSKVETKIVTKDVTKYVDDPLLEKEADRLRREVREETQRRRTIEEMVFDLQNKYIQLERQKPEEKVLVQEVVRLQKDPRQILDHDRLGRSLDEEVKNRRKFELEVQQMRALIEDKEIAIRRSDERQRKIQVETELRQIKSRIHELETAPPPIEENIVIEEVLKVERDPKLDKLTNGLRTDMDKESSDIMRLERDIRKLTLEIEILQREKSVEKTIYKDVVRVEKDQTVEAERSHLREQLIQKKNARRDLEDEIHRLDEKLQRQASKRTTTSLEETNLIHDQDKLQREKENRQRELRTLESERQNISISFHQQSKLMSERNQMNRQRSIKMESDVQRLEREILDEKDTIHKRDNIIRELKNSLRKEDSSETRTKEVNVSTKISILDPNTGKDMLPYDAYMQGFIDRSQYIQLQELECDWEEITTMGPDGEISVLQDRKSGKQYSIKNALKEDRVTKYQLQQYKDGKMPISEFALLVAGETKSRPYTPVTSQTTQQLNEEFPICGVYDVHTNSCLNVRSAMDRKMIDTNTAQKLLEAQAATGGIVDISNRIRYSVHKAADRSLIESSQLQRLLNAQKAFTGVEDPMTKERLSVGEAVQKGWMPKENAMRYMEAQFLTGGMVNPNKAGRVNIVDAVSSKMIDSTMMRELQEEINYAKELTDPITKEKINYKQALARCKTDPLSGLPMLPASSKDSAYSSSYFSHK